MRIPFALALALSSVVAGAANAAVLFSHESSYSTASIGLGAVGLAIVFFTGVSSLAVLVAGVWMSLHRQAEGHMRRLPSRPLPR